MCHISDINIPERTLSSFQRTTKKAVDILMIVNVYKVFQIFN